jgi:hypothetical protein
VVERPLCILVLRKALVSITSSSTFLLLLAIVNVFFFLFGSRCECISGGVEFGKGWTSFCASGEDYALDRERATALQT